MHFNAAFLALLAAAAGANAGTIEDRTYNKGGAPVCAQLCFQKAVEGSECKVQKHYIRTLFKNYNWECLCKFVQPHYHESVTVLGGYLFLY